MNKLVEWYKKSIDLQGDYVEKWYKLNVHFLTFTSIKKYFFARFYMFAHVDWSNTTLEQQFQISFQVNHVMNVAFTSFKILPRTY